MENNITLAKLRHVVESEWDRVTTSIPLEWSKENAMRGQCVPTALVVQDYLGGDIERVEVVESEAVNGETHYKNRLDDKMPVDLTVMQYLPFAPVKFVAKQVDLVAEGYPSMRERLLGNDLTRSRYEVLRSRVAVSLGRVATGSYDMAYQPDNIDIQMYLDSLKRTLGIHAERLLAYVAADNPGASSDEVVHLSVSAMMDGAAYMQPAYPWDIVDNSINMYRAYK